MSRPQKASAPVAPAAVRRKLRLRPPIAIAPLTISQLNCLHCAGIDDRRFLELLPKLGVHVSHVGRLRVVDAAEFLSAMRDLAVEPSTDVETTTVGDDADDLEREQPRSIDDVLGAIGRRATKLPDVIGGARLHDPEGEAAE